MGRQKLPESERKHRATFCFSWETVQILSKIPNKSAFVEKIIREKLQIKGKGLSPAVEKMLEKGAEEKTGKDGRRSPYGY